MNTCTVVGCPGLKYPTSSLLIEISLYSGKSWSKAIRVDLCWVEVELGLIWWLSEWVDYFSVCSWFSCRGAEQLMGYLLDGWRRCFECRREVVCAVQRYCSHSAWVLCSSGRGVGRFGTGRVAAELSCELSGARYGT